MINRTRTIMKRATQRQTARSAALVISGAYLLSRLLGLLRDRLLVSHFGRRPELSAYYAAFRLPELLFTLLVSGAFAVAFIPVLTQHLDEEDRTQAWRITSSLLNILVLTTIIGGVLIVIFAGPLTTVITPGFDKPTHDLTANLTRIMAITPVLFAISSVLGSVQQAVSRFTIFALAGVLYNVGIIAGIILFVNHFGVYGAAYGVVLGVVLQAVLQVMGLHGLGFHYTPMLGFNLSGVRRTLLIMIPRSIDQGIDQINYIIETIIGSTLAPGSITAFTLANNLKNVPLVLIASSITTAVFPQMAARAAKGARTELIAGYVRTARLILFLAIPSAVFCVIGRGYLVRLLYGFGDVDTANTLGWFAGIIVFTSLFLLVSRVFYAMQDTKTPLYLSLVSICFNTVLSVILAHRYGVMGLSMSASIIAFFDTLVLLYLLNRREGSFGEKAIWRGAWRMGIAGALMTAAMYVSLDKIVPLYAVDKGFTTLAPKFGLLVVVGVATYLIPCYVLKLDEAHSFVARVKDIMVRSTNLT